MPSPFAPMRSHSVAFAKAYRAAGVRAADRGRARRRH
jgi:hypothetical protein